MYASRSAVRASRAIRAPKQQLRYQSTNSPSPPASGAITGAIAGGATAFALGYGWYWFSGTRNVVGTAKEAQQYMQATQEQFKKQFQEKAPSPNEALKWLRQVSMYYAGFLPGASGFVNSTFDDLDKIREKHGDEVDKIVNDAYNELKGVSQKGMNLQAAQQAWEILQKHISRIAELAGDAAEDILNNHPKLKEAVGDNVQQLQQYSEQYGGPEAKKAYEDAKNQIGDILKNGVSADSLDKLRKLVQEKVDQVKKLADQAWQKGLEEAKPYLDKNPKIKELVEENASALKQGNVKELFEKTKDAVNSGSTEDLEKYVNQAKDKAEKSVSGSGLDQYLKAIPGGDQIWGKLGQLQEVAKQKGPEAEKLLKDTVKELSDVLSKKSEEAKKLGDEAAKKSK